MTFFFLGYSNSTETKAMILENLYLPLDVSVAIGFEFDAGISILLLAIVRAALVLSKYVLPL